MRPKTLTQEEVKRGLSHSPHIWKTFRQSCNTAAARMGQQQCLGAGAECGQPTQAVVIVTPPAHTTSLALGDAALITLP